MGQTKGPADASRTPLVLRLHHRPRLRRLLFPSPSHSLPPSVRPALFLRRRPGENLLEPRSSKLAQTNPAHRHQ
eukprot:2234473-Pyramimonas_sp.AAC.1